MAVTSKKVGGVPVIAWVIAAAVGLGVGLLLLRSSSSSSAGQGADAAGADRRPAESPGGAVVVQPLDDTLTALGLMEGPTGGYTGGGVNVVGGGGGESSAPPETTTTTTTSLYFGNPSNAPAGTTHVVAESWGAGGPGTAPPSQGGSSMSVPSSFSAGARQKASEM